MSVKGLMNSPQCKEQAGLCGFYRGTFPLIKVYIFVIVLVSCNVAGIKILLNVVSGKMRARQTAIYQELFCLSL